MYLYITKCTEYLKMIIVPEWNIIHVNLIWHQIKSIEYIKKKFMEIITSISCFEELFE